jgi:cytochrome c-type biogenesis protein CcmF
MSLGDICLKTAALLSVVGFVAALRWSRGSGSARKILRVAYLLMTVLLALAAVELMAAILTHDFSFDYVASYSSRDLPLIYLISSFWAGQKGTLLLWALMAALLGYPLMGKRSWEPAAVMACYLPTIMFLLALMLDPSGNPFKLLPQPPPDGNGLNQLLQDPWMAIHPPLTFLGYAAMTVPAVLAFVALFKGLGDDWFDPAIRWTLAAFIMLGSGIVLGGFWAYKVLGWGGYWGWDPVENASLIPWIVAAALLHGLLVQRSSTAMRRTNLALALAGYLLVLYSTFLTRSGVLAEVSVHSFQAGGRYKVLLAILLLATAVSLVAFFLFRGKTRPGKEIATALSWSFVLAAVIVLLGISATMILIGVSWPILSSFSGQTAALDISFYNLVGLILYPVLLALLGAAPFLDWGSGSWKRLLLRLLPALLVAAGGTAAAMALGNGGTGPLILFFFALLALTSNIIRLIDRARTRLLNSGAALAHVGFALMFVGIVASSVWGVGAEAGLPEGEPVAVLDAELTFTGHVAGSEPQDRWGVSVKKPGGAVTEAEVAMFRIAGGRQDSYMHRPAILRGLLGDLYIAPQGMETGGGLRTLDLVKDQPAALGGASLTFRHFQTEGMTSGTGMTVWAHLQVSRGDQEEALSLPYVVTQQGAAGERITSDLLPEMKLELHAMSVEQSMIRILLDEGETHPTQTLYVEVSTKPLIGLLWAGTILLGLGCAVALLRRCRDSR